MVVVLNVGVCVYVCVCGEGGGCMGTLVLKWVGCDTHNTLSHMHTHTHTHIHSLAH